MKTHPQHNGEQFERERNEPAPVLLVELLRYVRVVQKEWSENVDVTEMKRNSDLCRYSSGKDDGAASVAVRKSILSRR
jgi:hypothetical protein